MAREATKPVASTSVNGAVVAVVWYRFRATFRRRRANYLGVVLLVGLTGGIAMGSIAAARQTQSSYPRFLASTNPSDLTFSYSGAAAGTTGNPYSAALAGEIARLPNVRHVESSVLAFIAPLGANGVARLDVISAWTPVVSVDGLFFHQDRVAVTSGRMASPAAAGEVVMTEVAARALGVHVGQIVPMGVFTSAQANSPGFGTPSVAPERRLDAKLVGIVVLNSQVVTDEIDRSVDVAIFTPALARPVLFDAIQITYGIQLAHGQRDVGAMEKVLPGLLPPGSSYNFHAISHVENQVERAVRPQSIALGVFGAIAAMVCLLIATQAVSRHLRSESGDREVLRALGAGRTVTVSDGLIGLLGAVMVGCAGAVAIAVGMTPHALLGPVRPVYPMRWLSFDWTVLGLGSLVLVGGLGGAAVAMSYRNAPDRLSRASRRVMARTSGVARFAVSSGLPPPAVVGVRFALEPGRGRTSAPVRSALLGTALAVTMVVATLTFGSGLQRLVSHPALYGWNWTYMLSGGGSVPPSATTLLAHDPDVAAWTGTNLANAQIDGQTVPILLGDSQPTLSPPILAGHALQGDGQIVLGAATMAELGKRIGSSVVLSYGTPQDAPIYVPPTRLLVVGSATLPAVGFTSLIADNVSMGTGALVSEGVLPPAFQQASLSPDPNNNGPELVFVRMRNDLSTAAGRADMRRVVNDANQALAADPNVAGSHVTVLGIQRPAEIVNFRTMGSTPILLAGGLALGATAALGLTLVASVRRRRRDLALLKTLGFTRRQLTAVVSWQASVAAVLGIIVGIPLGIALGRQLWVLFARSIYAVPEPAVPVLGVALVVLATFIFANLVAVLPGRSAANTPTATVLRTE